MGGSEIFEEEGYLQKVVEGVLSEKRHIYVVWF